jgi:hypothetical protein
MKTSHISTVSTVFLADRPSWRAARRVLYGVDAATMHVERHERGIHAL